ncbi:MAG: hypothetical protein COA78_33730 [Blastopirellula sp.]|nr:MAG: hypothetical protein COA78_33730 [Blastopirellula sp.]
MICHNCGIEAPTKSVTFYQNIGLLFMRFSRTADGDFCKSCIHKTFWEFTLLSLVLGWWGIISFIVNIFFILNNIIRYTGCLMMEPVPFDATTPELTQEAVERINAHADDLFNQLNTEEDYERVVENIAMKANVSNGQVVMFIQAVVASQES